MKLTKTIQLLAALFDLKLLLRQNFCKNVAMIIIKLNLLMN